MNLYKIGILFVLLLQLAVVSSQEVSLWIFEDNFIKLGKRDVYENYKKEIIKSFSAKNFPIFAFQDINDPQYIYLTPIEGFSEIGDFFMRYDDSSKKIPPKKILPYMSTLNFINRALYHYLDSCSHIPRGQEDILDFTFGYFYGLSVDPINPRDWEAHFKALAQEQSAPAGICFMTWKALLSDGLPKYVIGVFGMSEKEIEKLELITPELKSSLQKQSLQKVKPRKNLSFVGRS